MGTLANACSIELLACPEHLEAQLQAMGTKRTDRQPVEESTSASAGFSITKAGRLSAFVYGATKISTQWMKWKITTLAN
jgi:hypothetical protein